MDEDMDRMMALCTCPACPSYNVCSKGKNEVLYCRVGRSACEMDRMGCICPTCPVYAAMMLSGDYFCVNGRAAKEEE